MTSRMTLSSASNIVGYVAKYLYGKGQRSKCSTQVGLVFKNEPFLRIGLLIIIVSSDMLELAHRF